MVNLLQTVHQPLTTRTRSWGSKHQQIFQSISVYTWGAKGVLPFVIIHNCDMTPKILTHASRAGILYLRELQREKNPHCQSEANCSVGSNKTETKNNMKILVLTLRVSIHSWSMRQSPSSWISVTNCCEITLTSSSAPDSGCRWSIYTQNPR
jgi:hypothetical protein